MKILKNICLLLMVVFCYACNDPYENTTYQIYDVNPASTYLETRANEFSEWIHVMKYADLFNAVNQASNKFTVFVPTNKAVQEFYKLKKVSSIEDLGKEYARSLVEHHIIQDSINRNEFVQGGKLETKTLSDDYLSVSFDETSEEGGFNSIYLNKDAHVSELAIQVSNGYIYVLDKVMPPLVESLYDRIVEQKDKYSIFIDAMDKTGWKDSINVIYQDVKQEDNTVIKQKRDYTLLAVSNESFAKSGITSFAGLCAKINAVGNDYTNKDNELNRYIAYHIFSGSNTILDLEDMGNGNKKLLTTKAGVALETSIQENKQLYFNYDGLINGISVKAQLIESGSDIEAKNGMIHELDSYLPLWESVVPIKVDWDFCDYAEIASYIKGGYGAEGQQYQTETDNTEYQSDISALSCFNVITKSSATPTSSYYPVGYATVRKSNAWTNCKNKDQMYLNLGYQGSISMRSPIVIAGKYKVVMKVTYATSMDFMRTMSNGSNGGKIDFIFDDDNNKTKTVALYASITANTLGLYDTVIFDEIEFPKTGSHTLKMVVQDPAAASNSKFRIQLDYMTFEPITE